MNNFEFCNPVKIIFGKGTIARLSAQIPREARVLILYGGGSIKKNGVYDQVKEALADFDTFEFGGIRPNPDYETCMRAVDLVKSEGITFLLAVGGGSVIDATKFVAAATYFDGEDPWDILLKGSPIREALPLGCVLTLAATGSEMNERFVISRNENRLKLGFASPLVFPKFAVLDPEVTYSLPLRQVINGVVDSFVHVIEQYLTYPVNSRVQDAFSESLMRIIVEEGKKVLKDKTNYDIRANLMWAASNALNSWIGQGVPQDWSSHRIGYSLTALFGLDHAQTLAIVLPGVMEYKKEAKREKILSLGRNVFDVTSDSDDCIVNDTINAVEDFFLSMGLPTRLAGFGIRKKDLDSLVEHIRIMDWKLGEHADIDWQVAREILALRF
ncbi:MAG: iron-containing alcohol dehydrogenase [Massilibacteroides sp.]|nr:iron-containing alcohol dehydrogenase [Massilibacteroides sp.]MDD3062537.1 iron-containing alcohol dehydrogenase [Massilibacteroides sp.]MDD4114530.1 iron-containing alcohol dehydrogenase [Massilibacteroides sp.]MDD4659371.1 iron-containing alcohol dehydrogenase [Massilibacteroides sp.]